MHELALTEHMLELALQAAERSGAERILQIDIRLGVLSGVIPSCVEYYFGLQSKGTIAEGARLNMQPSPLKIACRSCGREAESDRLLYACPHCGSEDFRLLAGREYFVESLTAE
ncbi:MAG: hydrogenase maturation nickel metallochaperone HypA [Firmicutes bacterium]|nr:hydrogenase maturation nickel metallochaperone HypA [Bacillota bacterium]